MSIVIHDTAAALGLEGAAQRRPAPQGSVSLVWIFCLCTYHLLGAGHVSNGHITVKAPHPIRTAKLSTVELDQYFGRGLQGNLQCCWAYFFFCRICDLKSPQMSHMRHILFTFHFFFAKSKLTNGSLRSGPPLCCPFHSQGRRCVMDRYTHEAEERNKIKF